MLEVLGFIILVACGLTLLFILATGLNKLMNGKDD